MQKLQNHLKLHQKMSFVDFMQWALYDPIAGYYSSGLAKFGSEGDFITAPELSPLFGQSLANHWQSLYSNFNTPVIFEFGAGTGALCVAILSHLEKLNVLPESYYILELSSNLRHRQEQYIQNKIPLLASKVHWLESWPDTPFQGLVIANEVLDAMPVHRFLLTEDDLLESTILLDAKQQLQEQFEPSNNPKLRAYVQEHLNDLDTPYLSEVNLFVKPWLAQLYQMLELGEVLLIDYGFPRHEYYHPDRNQGTLMCHHQHKSHSNFLLQPGEQDITAHVDFTQVAEAALEAGFHVAGYTNQASFLLENGLLHLLEQESDPVNLFSMKQSIKKLTHPNEMGELFKVMALTKNLDRDLQGFQLQDKRVSL